MSLFGLFRRNKGPIFEKTFQIGSQNSLMGLPNRIVIPINFQRKPRKWHFFIGIAPDPEAVQQKVKEADEWLNRIATGTASFGKILAISQGVKPEEAYLFSETVLKRIWKFSGMFDPPEIEYEWNQFHPDPLPALQSLGISTESFTVDYWDWMRPGLLNSGQGHCCLDNGPVLKDKLNYLILKNNHPVRGTTAYIRVVYGSLPKSSSSQFEI